MPKARPDQPRQLPKDVRQSIGERLRLELRRHKVSQATASRSCERSRAAVTNWVQGKNMPDFAALYTLATKHGLSVDYIITGKRIDEPLVLDLARQIAHMGTGERELIVRMFVPDDKHGRRRGDN